MSDWKPWEHTTAQNLARQRLHTRIDGMVLNAHFAIHHMALKYLLGLNKKVDYYNQLGSDTFLEKCQSLTSNRKPKYQPLYVNAGPDGYNIVFEVKK